MSWLLIGALLLPWVGLLALRAPRLRALALVLAPLPLGVLGLGGVSSWEAPNLLLGSAFAVDEVNRPLLLLAAVAWSFAGWFGAATVDVRPARFGLWWLLTLGGQAAALLAATMVDFYAGYAVMTVGAYGLIVHKGSEEARLAGRVYLVLALAGEALVLAGLLVLGARLGNIPFVALGGGDSLASALLLAGFAVKLGTVPVHSWLPLAHPVAPAAASAVLSAVLVKIGLLGMLRFVSPHSLDVVELLLSLGLFSAVSGVLMGLGQTRLKVLLAYSTVSQMGLALMGFAAVLGGAPPAALGLFALHHGLNKLALFLAAGHALRGRAASTLFALSALMLAASPLAKAALKGSLSIVGAEAWALGLSASTVLTTALMLHAWRLSRTQDAGHPTLHPAWIAAALAGALLPWLWAFNQGLPLPLGPKDFGSALWPVLLGLMLHRLIVAIPAPLWSEARWVARLDEAVRRLLGRWREASLGSLDLPPAEALLPNQTLARMEAHLGQVAVVGMLLLVLVGALWAAA